MDTAKNWQTRFDPGKMWMKIHSDGALSNMCIKITCDLCEEFAKELRQLHRNFSDAFIKGITETKLKVDKMKKHSTSDQHELHMLLVTL